MNKSKTVIYLGLSIFYATAMQEQRYMHEQKIFCRIVGDRLYGPVNNPQIVFLGKRIKAQKEQNKRLVESSAKKLNHANKTNKRAVDCVTAR